MYLTQRCIVRHGPSVPADRAWQPTNSPGKTHPRRPRHLPRAPWLRRTHRRREAGVLAESHCWRTSVSPVDIGCQPPRARRPSRRRYEGVRSGSVISSLARSRLVRRAESPVPPARDNAGRSSPRQRHVQPTVHTEAVSRFPLITGLARPHRGRCRTRSTRRSGLPAGPAAPSSPG
jgi:hypothetical protein